MILETCIMLAYLNTADPSGTTIYPSGIKDDGDMIFSAPPVAVYPLINIVQPILLSGSRVLGAGTYAVMPSQDEKSLIFLEGYNVICQLPVVENTIVEEYHDTPVVKVDISYSNITFTYHIENILKKAIIPLRQDC